VDESAPGINRPNVPRHDDDHREAIAEYSKVEMDKWEKDNAR
jgi:hypothetical protein